MTTATAPTTEALDIPLSDDERKSLGDAAEHYCKRLDKLAKGAADMGRTKEDADYTQEAERWREELVTPVKEGQRVTFYARHMKVLEKGCMLMATNMRAAKGTLSPFSLFADVVERLQINADHALNVLSVAFTPIMAGQAADDGEPSENVDRDCPACGKTFTTAADAPADQECVGCLAKRD